MTKQNLRDVPFVPEAPSLERAWFPLREVGEHVLVKGNPEQPGHAAQKSEERENDFVRPPARALASQVQPQPSGPMKAVPPEKLPTQKKG